MKLTALENSIQQSGKETAMKLKSPHFIRVYSRAKSESGLK